MTNAAHKVEGIRRRCTLCCRLDGSCLSRAGFDLPAISRLISVKLTLKSLEGLCFLFMGRKPVQKGRIWAGQA